jgi:MoaA/NifB/PqqE/SkfB family radical SAM enzyme
MLQFADIQKLHLEITSRCNLRCPQCPRNQSGGRVIPELPLMELTLSDVQTALDRDFVRQLRVVRLCGNYGDPIVARDTLEVLEHLRWENPRIKLRMQTNGSGREASWWHRLARCIDTCSFSIDGLENTNHIYRRGSDFQRVMASATEFIAAGGVAEWDFIVFRHNEHQVEAASSLSASLGFAKFNVVRSSRFMQDGRLIDRTPVYDLDGGLEYYVESPQRTEYQNDAMIRLVAGNQDGDRGLYYRETAVCCKAVTHKQIYLSAEGLVFPCCYTAHIYRKNGASCEVTRLLDRLEGGRDAINALKRPLQEIVQGEFFQEQVPAGWHPGAGRLHVCSRMCGEVDLVASQHPRFSTLGPTIA